MRSSLVRKAVTVSTAAVVLPVVLGVGPALADKQSAPGQSKKAAAEQSDSSGKPAAEKDEPGGQPTDPSGSSDNPDGTFQGKSTSTPDQDGTGADNGLDNNDKTGPGTDGNNGCGNEPRDVTPIDDDNNGKCLGLNKERQQAPDVQQPPTGGGGTGGTGGGTGGSGGGTVAPTVVAPATDRPADVGVLSAGLELLGAPAVASRALGAPAVVSRPLGAPAARVGNESAVMASGTPAALPFTGADTGLVALTAVIAIGAGGGLLVAARRRTV